MNRTQTLQVLAILKVAYPTLYQNFSQKELEDAADLWTAMFADDDPKLVMSATKAFIATDTKGYPPHIGAIKEKMRMLTKEDMPTSVEAWNNIWDTLRETKDNCMEAFNKLPPIVRSIVGSPSTLKKWCRMDFDTVESVISSNFQKAYRERAKEKQDYEALPKDLRALCDSNGSMKFLDEKASRYELPPRRVFRFELDENGYEKAVEVKDGDAEQ